MRVMVYKDLYCLYYRTEGLQVKLWYVEDLDGQDVTSKIDSHDWRHFEQYISDRLHSTFCYFNEC